MPVGNHIPLGALWTGSTALRLIDPQIARSTVIEGEVLLVNGKQFIRKGADIVVSHGQNAAAYHYEGKVYTKAPFIPIERTNVEQYFIGG